MITSQDICNKYFSKLKSDTIKLEKLMGGKVIFFYGELDIVPVYQLHKVLRKLRGKKLFLILESPGGQIDTAAKIVHLCKEYFKEFNVIVPSYAKSAATLICLAADNLFLGKCGELGPIDPQVRHPIEKDTYFPALAIKDAIDFIESSKDPFVKIGLTEKIDPYIMGAYKRIIDLAKQYLEDANLVKNSKNPKELINSLTQKYISHGYPIDLKECDNLGIKTTFFKKEKIMEHIYDLFEGYVDFMLENSNKLKVQLNITSSNLCVNKIDFKPEQKNIEEIEELIKPKEEGKP